jgi:chondroitin 4-sulfotransferase 11
MIDHKLKVLHVHIPKTGGLTIRYTLFDKAPDRYLHIKPTHVRYIKDWDDYFTFTFVRNPFDKLVSGYLFTLQKEKDTTFYQSISQYTSFNDFIKNVNKEKLLKSERFELQSNWFFQNFQYDFIGRFENLQEDFCKVCENLNIMNLKLPVINNSQKRKPYTDYYNNESRVIVEELYKKDLEYLN